MRLSHLKKAQTACICLLPGREGHQLPPLLFPHFPAWWSHGEAAWWGAGGQVDPAVLGVRLPDQAAEGIGSRSLCLGIKPFLRKADSTQCSCLMVQKDLEFPLGRTAV